MTVQENCMTLFRNLVMACLLILLAQRASAQGLSLGRGVAGRTSGQPMSARAAVNTAPLVTGSEAAIAVEVTIDPRYHIQSAYPEKDYIATSLAAKPVPGITFGHVRYPVAIGVPAPAALPGTPPIPVYEGTVYLLLPLTVDASAAPGPRTIDLTLTAQACDATSCLPPQDLPLSIAVTIAPAGTAMVQANAALFAAAARQQYAAEPTSSPATTSASAASAPVSPPISAVRLLSSDEQRALIAARPYRPANQEEYPVGVILILALVGGLILNIMPCVLPVVPLKVLSLVQQAHGDRRLAVMHGLVFSAGVVSLFVALAIVLKALDLFYGQQFQNPAFLIAIALMVVALALSMLGVWTINPPRVVYAVDARLGEATGGGGGGAVGYARPDLPGRSTHYLGAFANGIMATLLATPCSAPYLGPVFAWAFVRPAWITTFALALVGVGMSLPYLVLAAFPKLINRLPRTGRWSELLKQGLGIVMLGVAVYLITLVPNATWWPWILLGGVVVGLTCWGWGQIPTPVMSPSRIWAIRGTVLLMGLGLGTAILIMAARSPATSLNEPSVGDGEWMPFNVALLDDALGQGRPVVVDWTANWCINCRALEAAVLSRDGVRQQFKDRHALLLRADLSANNPPAQALNEKLGGQAIPVLAIFAPSHPYEPVVLRDSYTTTRVISELERAQ